MKTKFSKIIIVSYFSLGLLGIALGVFYHYTITRNILLRHFYGRLENIAQLKSEHIKTFLTGKKEVIMDFSSDGFIIDSLVKLRAGANPKQVTEELNSYLILNKLPINKDFYEVLVLGTDGSVAGATKSASYFGIDFSESPIFLKGKRKPYLGSLSYDEINRIKSITLAAPILRKKEFLGVLAVRMLPETLIKITTDINGLGRTGKIYLINKDKYLLTPSRFLRGENKGVLTQVVDTKNAQRCLEEKGKRADFVFNAAKDYKNRPETFLDYRGEDVFGAYAYIDKTGWCLLVEMDADEMLGSAIIN